MSNFYMIKTTDEGCLDISKPGSTSLCYRMTYQNLKRGNHGLEIKNPFIVYILHAKNYEGKDFLYVGKSKNGILHRPKKHEDKGIDWDTCYVITQFLERTILNDGTIQYLEDIFTEKANETNCYNVLTQQTTKGTANQMDEINCQILLEDVIEMLFTVGLDLKTKRKEAKTTISPQVIKTQKQDNTADKTKSTIVPSVPDGIYYLNVKIQAWDKPVTGTMRVENGKYIVQKGSICYPVRGKGWTTSTIIDKKRELHSIIDDILQEDVEFNSPSMAAAMLTWRPESGWDIWKTEDGDKINIFKPQTKPSRKESRKCFWEAFNSYIENNKVPIKTASPNEDSWNSYSIGSSNYHFIFSLVNRLHFIRIEFIIGEDKTIYDYLYSKKDEIESQLDFPIFWDRKEGRKYCHIYSKAEGLDFSNQSNWPDLMEEMSDKCLKMKEILLTYLNNKA